MPLVTSVWKGRGRRLDVVDVDVHHVGDPLVEDHIHRPDMPLDVTVDEIDGRLRVGKEAEGALSGLVPQHPRTAGAHWTIGIHETLSPPPRVERPAP